MPAGGSGRWKIGVSRLVELRIFVALAGTTAFGKRTFEHRWSSAGADMSQGTYFPSGLRWPQVRRCCLDATAISSEP
jgi:hypothetical protein